MENRIEIIKYVIFGVLTTIINMVAYSILFDSLLLSNSVATVIAWFVAVLFAFITNKIFVFKSKKKFISEIFFFF